jgi:G3E family GTPase
MMVSGMNTTLMDKRIPVLVVSGFLGSGKTTLVSHLLKEAQATGARLAVVSNEFGALGIDQTLLGQGGEAYAELEGGCVCCQLSDELVKTLQML